MANLDPSSQAYVCQASLYLPCDQYTESSGDISSPNKRPTYSHFFVLDVNAGVDFLRFVYADVIK